MVPCFLFIHSGFQSYLHLVEPASGQALERSEEDLGSGSPCTGTWAWETISGGDLVEGVLHCGIDQGQELCTQLVGA